MLFSSFSRNKKICLPVFFPDYQLPSSTPTSPTETPSGGDKGGEGGSSPTDGGDGTDSGGGGGSSNFFLQNPAILAAVISALIAAVFCLVLCAVFVLCRMKRRDRRGNIELDTRIGNPSLNGAAADPRSKMYLYNKPQCREIYA